MSEIHLSDVFKFTQGLGQRIEKELEQKQVLIENVLAP